MRPPLVAPGTQFLLHGQEVVSISTRSCFQCIGYRGNGKVSCSDMPECVIFHQDGSVAYIPIQAYVVRRLKGERM